MGNLTIYTLVFIILLFIAVNLLLRNPLKKSVSNTELKLDTSSSLDTELELDTSPSLGTELKLDTSSSLDTELELDTSSSLGTELELDTSSSLSTELDLDTSSSLDTELELDTPSKPERTFKKEGGANIINFEEKLLERSPEIPIVTQIHNNIYDDKGRLSAVERKYSINRELVELEKAEVKNLPLTALAEKGTVGTDKIIPIRKISKALLKSVRPGRYVIVAIDSNMISAITDQGEVIVDNWKYTGPQSNTEALMLLASEFVSKIILYHPKHDDINEVLNVMLSSLESVTAKVLAKVKVFSVGIQYRKIHQNYNDNGGVAGLTGIMKLEGLPRWDDVYLLSQCKRINLLLPILHANKDPIYIVNEKLNIKSKLTVSRMSNLLDASKNSPVDLFWRDLSVSDGKSLGLVASTYGYELNELMPELKLVVKHAPKPHIYAFYPTAEELEEYDDYLRIERTDPIILKLKKAVLLNAPKKKQITFNINIDSAHKIPDDLSNLQFDNKSILEYSKDKVFRCHMFNNGKKVFSTLSSNKPFITALCAIENENYTLEVLAVFPKQLKVKLKIVEPMN